MKEATLKDGALDELRFEYEQLRHEILHNDILNMQILAATLLLVSTLMSIAFSEAIKVFTVKGGLFLLVEAIAFIGLSQSINRESGTFTTATYLRIFIENRIENLKWETRLAKFRRLSKFQNLLGALDYQRRTYTFIALINFALGFAYIWLDYQDISSPYQSVDGVLLIISILSIVLFLETIRRRYSQVARMSGANVDAIWRKIRDEERAES